MQNAPQPWRIVNPEEGGVDGAIIDGSDRFLRCGPLCAAKIAQKCISAVDNVMTAA
jgi:hypothetical protein